MNTSRKAIEGLICFSIVKYGNARKYGNVTVKDFLKYEKLEYKNSKLKLDIGFINNCKQLGVCPKFLIFKLLNVLTKTLYLVVKDSFVVLSISVIKNSNIFQKNSVYQETTYYLHSFLLLTSTSLQNL